MDQCRYFFRNRCCVLATGCYGAWKYFNRTWSTGNPELLFLLPRCGAVPKRILTNTGSLLRALFEESFVRKRSHPLLPGNSWSIDLLIYIDGDFPSKSGFLPGK